MEWRVPSLSCSFTTAFIMIWSLLSFCKRIFIILVTARGMAILQSLSWKMPRLSKVRCSIPLSTRMGRSTKVGGKGSPVGGIQKYSGWRWPPFFNTLISAKLWKSSPKKSQFLWWFPLWQSGFPERMFWKKNVMQNLFVFPTKPGKGPWLLAPTPRRMKLVSALIIRIFRWS